MVLEMFPQQGIEFSELFDGRLEKYGIATEIGDASGKLIAADGALAIVQKKANGGCKCGDGMPDIIRTAIAREFNVARWRALIEGPSTRDIDFAAAWLIAVVGARESFGECSKDARFRGLLDYLQVRSCIEFHSSAMDFIGRWLQGEGAFEFEVPRHYVRGVTFTVMNALGFFTLTGQRYQMTIPANITQEDIRRAVHRLSQIHDGNGCIYPEHLVVSMEPQEAEESAVRLRDMREDERLADRNALLDR